MTGYEAFSIYHVLKLHFTTNYDYFKYNGKCNITIETFEKRKDKYYFYKLSRKYDTEEYKEFVISNLLNDPDSWAGNLLTDEASDIHMNRMKRVQSLSYTFKSDCQEMMNYGRINDLLRVNSDYPKLFTLSKQRVVSDESIIILNSLMNFLPKWKQKISDNIVWPIAFSRWMRYTPFVAFDKDKYRKIALEVLE
jgi:hypothetical protein